MTPLVQPPISERILLDNFEARFADNFARYGLATLIDRALPDARDGMKPVQRRILWCMLENGVTSDKKFAKSADVVGRVLGDYHPHGDQSVYLAAVRLAQDWVMRYPLIDFQGNGGCFTGDTRIRLADGTERSFRDLANLSPGQTYLVPAVDASGRHCLGRARHARLTRRRAALVEITFSDGSTVRCTPDHRFLLRDGTYKAAGSLSEHDDLMTDPGPGRSAGGDDAYPIRVVAVRFLDERADVYDLTVDDHHNFMLANGVFVHNSIDGDPPAAYRYTEMRLQKIAEAHMADIRKNTVPLVPTYKQDPKILEPLYLPGRIPPVCLPNQGIAVGQTSVIPPHNLGEVLRACIALLENPDLSVDQIMRYIQGPDFPTGGIIVGIDGIKEYLTTGKGQIVVRGVVHLEQTPRGNRLVITEIPCPTTMRPDKAALIDSIRDAVNDGKLDGITDLRDESDQDHGIRIVLEIKGVPPAKVVDDLYRLTQLQVTVNVVMTFVFGNPWERGRHARQVGMVELLNYWNRHQLDVLTRRTQHDLRVARDRLHVVEGLIVGACHADEIVRIFQTAKDRASAKAKIMRQYRLTEVQANTIAEMTLAQVTRLNATQYREEERQLRQRIADLEALLADPTKMRAQLKQEMQALIAEFGDERRTRIDRDAAGGDAIANMDVIPPRPLFVLLTRQGSIVTVAANDLRSPRRGSERAVGFPSRHDALARLVPALSTHVLLCVSDRGRVFALPVEALPEQTRTQKGESLRRYLALEENETIRAVLPVDRFSTDRYLVVFTARGKVKKTALSDYRNASGSGLNDLKVAPDDAVVDATIVDGGGSYLVVTSAGKALRFADDDLRAQGRTGQGVQAVRLPNDAFVVATLGIGATESRDVLMVTAKGYGKRVRLGDVPIKGRATGGVETIQLTPGDMVAAVTLVRDDDEVLVITAGNRTTRLLASEIRRQGRATRGARLVTFADRGDRVASVAVLAPAQSADEQRQKPLPVRATARRKEAAP